MDDSETRSTPKASRFMLLAISRYFFALAYFILPPADVSFSLISFSFLDDSDYLQKIQIINETILKNSRKVD